MKYLQKLAILLAVVCAGFAFSSCGDDDEPETPRVELIAASNTNLVLNYLDSTVDGGLTFNAVGDWSADFIAADASFTPMSANQDVSWITAVPYKGTTGVQKLRLFVSPNRSNAARYAIIRINSVTNYIDFHVTQKGMPSAGGGDTPIPNPEA